MKFDFLSSASATPSRCEPLPSQHSTLDQFQSWALSTREGIVSSARSAWSYVNQYFTSSDGSEKTLCFLDPHSDCDLDQEDYNGDCLFDKDYCTSSEYLSSKSTSSNTSTVLRLFCSDLDKHHKGQCRPK